VALAQRLVSAGALGRIYHVRAAYLQSWGGPDTPLLWRFQGDVAGSGAHGDLNAHIIDTVRFITGEEIVTVEGAIEHTFIEERELLAGASGGEIGGAGAATAGTKGRSTVDDAVLFLARMSGGALASFEASRLATGYHNGNRFEIHGERGALRFDFERMNELHLYSLDNDSAVQGWTTIDVTRAGSGHPYAEAWWPDSHGLGYEHTFVNQASDILTVLGGGQPVAALPDFADALKTQRVLHAAIASARNRAPVDVADV
jgi:predicted dehydrogenase